MVSPVLRLIAIRLVRPTLQLVDQVRARLRVDVELVALEPLVEVVDPRVRVLPRRRIALRLEALALEPVNLPHLLMPAKPPPTTPRVL